MHEKSKTKTRAGIALALCFCVVALTSFLAVQASLNKIADSGTTASDAQTPVADNQEAAVQTPVVDSQGNDSSAAQDDGNTSDSVEEAADYITPLEGDIQLKYSMDGLVYSKTLDQYMTHPGIDLSARLSTEVCAIADGTVTKVYTDDRYGVTVCVAHDNGLASVYSNLAEQGLVETGDDVKQGDTIGCVGDTALFESLEESHLHFAMTKDGNPVDPGEFIDAYKTAE